MLEWGVDKLQAIKADNLNVPRLRIGILQNVLKFGSDSVLLRRAVRKKNYLTGESDNELWQTISAFSNVNKQI